MKKIILQSKNITKDSFVYNGIAATLNSFQTMILLLIITRMNQIEDASIFVMAYAIANFLLAVGKFGVRNYQATDITERYNVNDYIKVRVISNGVMILGILCYLVNGLWFGAYTLEKTVCIIMVCILKFVDSTEDVYHGRLQQLGRLDIGAKILSIRLISYMLLFVVLYVIMKDLMIVFIIATLYYIIIAYYLNYLAIEQMQVEKQIHNKDKSWKKLLLEIIPLAITTILMMYLVNAPKYIIDEQVTDLEQTAYNIIFMPVFVIALLSSYIYNPLINGLAKQWKDGQYSKFIKTINYQILIVIGITTFGIGFACVIGLDILELIYKIDLSSYLLLLMLLLLAGGLQAFLNLMNVVCVIWRKQKILMHLLGISVFLFFIIGNYLFKEYNLMGVTVAYLIVLIILAISLYGVFIWQFYIKKRKL